MLQYFIVSQRIKKNIDNLAHLAFEACDTSLADSGITRRESKNRGFSAGETLSQSKTRLRDMRASGKLNITHHSANTRTDKSFRTMELLVNFTQLVKKVTYAFYSKTTQVKWHLSN